MPALSLRLAVAGVLALAGPSVDIPDRDDVLTDVNALRADPPAYGAALAGFEAMFLTPAALNYRVPGEQIEHVTHEGVVAVREARRALTMQPALGKLEPSRILREAARDHVEEQAESGALGHFSRNGEGPGARVKAHGGDIYVAEAISYGAVDAADVVRQLVVDDGVPSRGHRKILLSSAYRYAGIWCGRHARYRTMCVIDLAQTADGSPWVPGAR